MEFLRTLLIVVSSVLFVLLWGLAFYLRSEESRQAGQKEKLRNDEADDTRETAGGGRAWRGKGRNAVQSCSAGLSLR